MTEQDHFLATICDHPHDDAPRLIYADWLEERGDPRAEFIRVQCERAHLPDDDPRQPALAKREWELLKEHRDQWTPALGREIGYVEFRRGFVEALHLSTAAFLRRGERLFRKIPLLRVVLTAARPERMPELAASPLLARLTGLQLYGPIEEEGAVELFASPHLTSLRELDLTSNRLGPDAVAALLGSSLTGLTRLGLGHNALDDPEAEALAASPNLARLTELGLEHNKIGDLGVTALATSPYLSSLRVFRLGCNRVRDRGAQALASSPNLAGLRHLSLWNNPIGDAGALALAGSSHLAGLRELNLGNGRISTAGQSACLAALPEGRQLRYGESPPWTPTLIRLGDGKRMVGLAGAG
jgi:uncharacterized protein (TIGR02996 family)